MKGFRGSMFPDPSVPDSKPCPVGDRGKWPLWGLFWRKRYFYFKMMLIVE